MAKLPRRALPIRLLLPEAVDILAEFLDCAEGHARALLERAIRSHSLRNIGSFHPDGPELPTDVNTWHAIEWESGIVTIETTFSGSPPSLVPILPLIDRDELFNAFKIDASRLAKSTPDRGGRPLQHDWDAFWAEVCRRVYVEGLPPTQQELVTEMLTWFANRGDQEIDESTVRKKISMLFDTLRPE